MAARRRPSAEAAQRQWSLREDVEYLDWLARLSTAAAPLGLTSQAGSIVELRCTACGEVRTTSTLWGAAPLCCGQKMDGHVHAVAGADVWP